MSGAKLTWFLLAWMLVLGSCSACFADTLPSKAADNIPNTATMSDAEKAAYQAGVAAGKKQNAKPKRYFDRGMFRERLRRAAAGAAILGGGLAGGGYAQGAARSLGYPTPTYYVPVQTRQMQAPQVHSWSTQYDPVYNRSTTYQSY